MFVSPVSSMESKRPEVCFLVFQSDEAEGTNIDGDRHSPPPRSHQLEALRASSILLYCTSCTDSLPSLERLYVSMGLLSRLFSPLRPLVFVLSELSRTGAEGYIGKWLGKHQLVVDKCRAEMLRPDEFFETWTYLSTRITIDSHVHVVQVMVWNGVIPAIAESLAWFANPSMALALLDVRLSHLTGHLIALAPLTDLDWFRPSATRSAPDFPRPVRYMSSRHSTARAHPCMGP